jgi:hypothetical protein
MSPMEIIFFLLITWNFLSLRDTHEFIAYQIYLKVSTPFYKSKWMNPLYAMLSVVTIEEVGKCKK